MSCLRLAELSDQAHSILAVSTLTEAISAPKAMALRARKATAGQEQRIQQRSIHHFTNAGQQIAVCGYTSVEPF
jgi:hypothetical protein